MNDPFFQLTYFFLELASGQLSGAFARESIPFALDPTALTAEIAL
jgi:hypothetical protein